MLDIGVEYVSTVGNEMMLSATRRFPFESEAIGRKGRAHGHLSHGPNNTAINTSRSTLWRKHSVDCPQTEAEKTPWQKQVL